MSADRMDCYMIAVSATVVDGNIQVAGEATLARATSGVPADDDIAVSVSDAEEKIDVKVVKLAERTRRHDNFGATARGSIDARAALEAGNLSFTIGDHSLLSDVSFAAQPGTVTAVIGPSGAGKSTLIRILGGLERPSSGTVTFAGRDVHLEYSLLRFHIGLVPQDDVVHALLTVDQALNYAAALRLPATATPTERAETVSRVLSELNLSPHRHTRIDKLSGGQRKRASVAMELLTSPSLLILDEPTSDCNDSPRPGACPSASYVRPLIDPPPKYRSPSSRTRSLEVGRKSGL
jgi:ABC-type lipoprotein export system ATPase subunit